MVRPISFPWIYYF